jgi:acetyl esterase/lipase
LFFVLAIMCALFVLGAFFPSVPYVGLFGSLALSIFPGWVTLIALVVTILLWSWGRRAVWRAGGAISLAATLGGMFLLWGLAGVACKTSACPTVAQTFGLTNTLAQIEPDEVVLYARDQGDDLTLRIFRPTGPRPAGGWPVYFHIHGGGWIGGSNAEQSADMRWFADQGWLVISAGYSLSNEQRHLWDRVTAQLGCAMAWTHANIGERGGNINRLALRGNSAGGNLALNVSYLANASKLPSICGGTTPRVRSVTAVYPGIDLHAIYENPHALIGPEVRSMVTQYTGGSPQDFPERYAAVNTATHITSAAPPTLMIVSENDHLVPLESMRRFASQVRAAGVEIKTADIPFADHGFDLVGIGNEIARQAALQFITAHDSDQVSGPNAGAHP